jgi:hypothetical protein
MSGEQNTSFIFKLLETTFTNSFYAKAYYGEADLYHTIPPIQVAGVDLYYEPVVYYEMLIRGLARTILVLFNPFIHHERFMVTAFTGAITPMFFLIGLMIALRNWKDIRFQTLLTWTLMGLFIFSVLSAFPPSANHTISIIPAFSLLCAVGIIAVSKGLWKDLDKKISAWLGSMTLILILVITTWTGWQKYFVDLPREYPPSFEDIASWIAWRNEDTLTIVYIGQRIGEPHRVQYLVDTHMVPHKYFSTTPRQFDWQNIPKESIIFFEHQADGIHLPPPAFKNTATYTHPQQGIIGYAWTDTEIDLQPVPPFPISDRDFPVTIIPVLTVFAIIVYSLLTVQVRVTTGKTNLKPGFRIQAEFILRKSNYEKD